MTTWRRWVRQPQSLWIRKAIFQVHLWVGVAIGLYILLISVTGSLVVFSGGLYRWATPPRVVIVGSGPPLSDEQLKEAARRAYPGAEVASLYRFTGRNAAVEIAFAGDGAPRRRLFHPYTGEDLRDSVPVRIRLVAGLVDLHANLLAGSRGQVLNGIGGILSILLGLTGLVVWWPGIVKWRRSLMLHRGVGWKRFNWDMHSALGIWSFAFLLLFGITGVYLCFPVTISHAFDRIEPPTDTNLGIRTVDRVLYWLAYLHFGRFGGWTTTIAWVIFGLAPAVLFVTGTVMWWNRVVWPRRLQLPGLKGRQDAATPSQASHLPADRT